jgi:hypothetical protein
MKRHIKTEINRFVIIVIVLCSAVVLSTKAQKVAIKNNLAYTAFTFTPNLGVEISLGKKSSVNLHTSYNPWNLNGNTGNTKKLVHWTILPEYRYWFKESLDGHYVGVHGLFSKYNIGQRNVNMLFGKESKNYRFEGKGNGAGMTYGYQWHLSKKWSIDTNLGVGFIYMNYKKFDAIKCGKCISSEKKTYTGITKVGINLIYRLN